MPLFLIILICLITVPILEIYLLIEVGGSIGFWQTFGLVILTAIVGIILLRTQGGMIARKLQARLERGEQPTNALIEGMLAAFGALLLLIPGFFTDVIGLFCITPILRFPLVWWLQRYIRPIVIRTADLNNARNEAQSTEKPSQKSHESVVIEGEYRREK